MVFAIEVPCAVKLFQEDCIGVLPLRRSFIAESHYFLMYIGHYSAMPFADAVDTSNKTAVCDPQKLARGWALM